MSELSGRMPTGIGYVLDGHDGHPGIENGPRFVDGQVRRSPFLVILATCIVPADVAHAKPESPGKILPRLGRIDLGVGIKSDDSLWRARNSTGQGHEHHLIFGREPDVGSRTKVATCFCGRRHLSRVGAGLVSATRLFLRCALKFGVTGTSSRPRMRF